MAIPYKKAPRLLIASAAVVALLGGGKIALDPEEAAHQQEVANKAVQTIGDYEGYVPEGYLDPVNIPTRCYGEIEDVVVGKKYTFEECEAGLNKHVAELLAPVRQCLKPFDSLPDKTKIAIASMTYNIGSKAMCESSIVRNGNAGNYEAMCRRMGETYKYATDRKTGKKVELKGLAVRRKGESDLCFQGLREQKELQAKHSVREPSPPQEVKEVVESAPVPPRPPSLLQRVCDFIRRLLGK